MDVDQGEPSTTPTSNQTLLQGEAYTGDVTAFSEEKLRAAAQFFDQYTIDYMPFCPGLKRILQPYAITGIRLEFSDATSYGFYSTVAPYGFNKIGDIREPVVKQIIALRPFLHADYESFLNDWSTLVTQALLSAPK